MPAFSRPSIYWLLVFLPVSIVAQLVARQPLLVFLSAALALIPLAGLLGRATEELAIRSGPRVGGLLNATFGNFPEVLIAVMLLRAGEVEVLKASLVGSILSNLVLVLGVALFAGGLRFEEQHFSARSAAFHAASLMMAVTGLSMPTFFALGGADTAFERLAISGVVALVLIGLYIASLVFSLVTHDHLFYQPSGGQPEWPAWLAIGSLFVVSLVIGLESEYLAGSLEPTVSALGISKIFIGMFVVGVIGNAAEHIAAVGFAIRNRLDIAIEITFGSATQVALFVVPALVCFGLLIGHPMDLTFPLIQLAAVALAATIVALMTLDGRGNWLKGLQLIGAYVIMGASFFFFTSPRS
jgi:Ca2+:H+ antiporter